MSRSVGVLAPGAAAARDNVGVTSVVIVGGGPGGYEAAIVAAALGGDVVLVDSDGVGGSAVLTDCVPSKTLIATAEVMTLAAESGELGVRLGGAPATPGLVGVDLGVVNARVKALAARQSDDIRARLVDEGVRVVAGHGRLDGPSRVVVTGDDGEQTFAADMVLLATGARPRIVPGAEPDGERILTWEQVYDLPALPERLIVVGSGVTGAEFASAYNALGSDVVLVSSRDLVLPGEDPDAATVIEDVFARRGMTVLSRSRARAVRRIGDGVEVDLADGRVVAGSHCLMAVGSIPNTEDLQLAGAGVATDDRGFITVDRVSRTTARGVYGAGDCTGVLMLASVAAMQGRIAVWHMMGDAVNPLELKTVSSNVFTDPEIATVGAGEAEVASGRLDAVSCLMSLSTNPRAKMLGFRDGFVKLFCRRGSGTILGAVIVAPRASELIYPLAIAVEERLNVDQFAHSFSVYPSLTGTIGEAARRLHREGVLRRG
ncbi:MAG: NAD(P)H-quinone dehydrogenase [Actinomycetota bacterium]|nr:MAG: NAD(P)H-quinone dehydrogenase [Actinomycetota bacterium]